MSNSNIITSLEKLFEKNRVVFWYDENLDFKEEYDTLVIDNVEKIHVDNNEFKIKYIINKEKTNTSFLLYFDVKKPKDEENWLLDIELSNYVFETDKSSMHVQDIGLDYHTKNIVDEHISFFNSEKRKTAFKNILTKEDSHNELLFKMLAVVFNTEHVNIETYIQIYASNILSGTTKFANDLAKYNLDKFFWTLIEKKYNYESEQPNIYEFVVELFSANFSLTSKANISRESKILFSLWKDSLTYRDSFIELSNKVAVDIKVEHILLSGDIDDIKNQDVFKLIDFKIISSLISALIERSISFDKIESITKERRNKFWYSEFSDFYDSIDYASKLLFKVSEEVELDSIVDVQNMYVNNLYKIDLFYRKFIYHFRRTNNNKVLDSLAIYIDKVYANDWLFDFNNKWQKLIDSQDNWPANVLKSQFSFFNSHVKQYIARKQRLFVVISDALRFECGKELCDMFSSENRYEAKLDYMESSLPSYTQLGMAALLPHENIEIQRNKEAVVVDGLSSAGIVGRSNILAKNSGVRATAVKAEEFMNFNSAKEGRDFVKDFDLIYIYHNRIDKLGDDKTSEDKVFEAVSEELEYLKNIVKKVANMNGNHIMITADHGFLYQASKLEDGDFSNQDIDGDKWKENRRFIFGNNIKENSSYKIFKGKNANLNTDVDIALAKSINRFRIKGSGSKFVHGGSSLQEIIVPLVKIARKREDNVSKVDVNIIKSTDKITTNTLPVSFVQTQLVKDNVLARNIRVGLYAENGDLISDLFEYCFDISEGSERQREVKHSFQLSSKASSLYKNQRVRLRLEEPVDGTNIWTNYEEYYFTLNISFTNDFDF